MRSTWSPAVPLQYGQFRKDAAGESWEIFYFRDKDIDGTFLKAGAFDSLGIEASAHHSCAAFGPLACGSIVRMVIIL